MRSWRWGPPDGINVLRKRDIRELSLPLVKRGRTQQDGGHLHTKAGRGFSPRIKLTGILILSFPTSKTASGLCNFVIGAKADYERGHILIFSIRNVVLFACHRHLPLLSATSLDLVASSGKLSNMSIQWPASLIKYSLTVVVRVFLTITVGWHFRY